MTTCRLHPISNTHHTSNSADIGTTTLLDPPKLQNSAAIIPTERGVSRAQNETSHRYRSNNVFDNSRYLSSNTHHLASSSDGVITASSAYLFCCVSKDAETASEVGCGKEWGRYDEGAKPEDGSDTLTHGMRNLNITSKGYHHLESETLDTTTDAQENRRLAQNPIESATTAETDHISNELSPKRQSVNESASRCSLIAPGIMSLSPRHSRTQISVWSTDTSTASSSSQIGSLDSSELDSSDVFQAIPTVNPSPELRPEHRVLLDNGLSIGCSMSSNSAYLMASAPNSPAAGVIAAKSSDHKPTGAKAGVNKWRRIAAKEANDDIAADAVDLTPRANRIRKRAEGLPLQESTDNILATPRRRSRPWAIYQPSPTKKAKLSPLYLPHPDMLTKEKVKSSVGSGMLTAPLMFRARDVSRPVESLPRRSEKGSLAEKLGLGYRSGTTIKAGPLVSPLPGRRKETSCRDGSILTVPRTRGGITSQAIGLISPLPPLGSDIKAAVDERFLQVRKEEASHGSSLAGKVSPSLMGNASVDGSGRSLVCDAGSGTFGKSWVTHNPDAKPVQEVAANSQFDTPTLSDDDQTLTPLMDSLLLTPDGKSHNRLPDSLPPTQTHPMKPRLYGLGLDIFPEEPIQLSVPRRWDACTWQQSFRRTADYNDAMARFGAIEGKR